MAFKSYSWSIGTTSFRTSQLNYKIERQLQLLKEFWNINSDNEWNNDTQEKYYNYLKEKDFVAGDAKRRDKDAREKTSGLVDIGVLTSDRKLTEVGVHIEELLNKKESPIVFILWGSFARSKKKLITNKQHYIIESAHPSPLSAHNGFFGSKPFSKTNNFLISKGLTPINWKID